MKFSLLLSGALWIGAPAFAQVPAQPVAQVAAQPTGYDLLVQAGEKILPGPNGGASNTDPTISPAENLKRERLAVARNAPALALVRLALQKPIEIPEATGMERDIQFNAKIRELARQFSQESDIRVADGDFDGAMNSRLDAMEVGAAIGHGVLISMFSGDATESIGMKDADKVAVHLDAAQCRAAIARLSAIETRRVSLEEALRREQKANMGTMLKNIGDPKAWNEVKPSDDGEFPTAQDIAEFKTLTREKFIKNYTRLFDAAVKAAQLPYFQAVNATLPQDLDPYSKLSVSFLQGGRSQFGYERTVTQSRLLRAALELRAQKLESGHYPENFTAPVDPFSPDGKSLVYRKVGTDYLLYSVGPDGKDDGGAEIQTIEVHEETGIKSVSDRLRPESTGDIVQSPF